MGCDIHILVEKKVGDKWVMLNRIDGVARERNYARFASLAGVRGEGPAPKGIPPDLSDSGDLFLSEWEGDAHSHSFLGLKEAADIFIATDPRPDQWGKKYPAEYYFNVAVMERDLDKYRAVFWFDN